MKRALDKIVAALSLEEKASLCSGRDFWNTKSFERLGIYSWMMADGPHGLRKQVHDTNEAGLRESAPATCFPSGATLAATWNRELVEEVGQALGREAKAMQVGVLLGPAVNIKRSPLCGRNFEYLSEDPYLTGELAKRHIMGVQSQGVGASIKHFATNNQEKSRMSIDAVVDERALREIYLPAFETAVKEAQPWTVMCAYNRLNGHYCSENAWLLDRVLKREWGHTGIVITDWGACADRVEGLKAGQDLDMPGDGGITDAEIVAAVEDGSLDERTLDAAVSRILDVSFRVLDNLSPSASFDAEAHHQLARRVAAEGIVLLKNEGGLLPIAGRRRVAFIGEFARRPRYQGRGSSHVNPTRIDDALEEARALCGDSSVEFAAGYSLSREEPDPALASEAVALAAASDLAVLFIGLPESWESEGIDRSCLGMPKSHLRILESIASVQKNLVVVLSNGAPIEMPWIDEVPAVLETYLGGQAWGGAVADILFGRQSPSGKLAESFPKRLEDNPSFLNFPGDARRVEYREGIFVGYRYYDAARVEPLFPFGHGLSYSRFEYSDLRLDKDALCDTETLGLGFDLENLVCCLLQLT
jgi:beta-glucosidase